MKYSIVIDAGHGGADPGASGNGIVEKDLTLKISQYMYNRFKNLGIPVTMTRTTDETLSPTERVERILNAYGNNSNVIVISNHINAGGGDGAEVIYALRNNDTLANLILNNLELAGQNVRDAFQRRLPSDTSKDYYFIHRDTGKTQPIIVEYGFLDSSLDDPNQLKNDYEKLTDAVVNGVLEYIGYENETTNYYTVKSGDSLWSIAKKFNTTVNELKDINNLTSNTLSIGQRLLIPTSTPTTGTTYKVVAGDTLYSIARKYNLSVDDIVNANNLKNNTLTIGQEIIIPTATTTNPPANEPNNNNYINYTVKSGDSLYSISKAYDTTMQDIINLNNLSSTLLSIGQILKIPVQSNNGTGYITYVVKSGDNLYSIARQYNTSVNELMEFNNLKTNLLSLGQTIKIPNANTYTVVSGDSLYSIAKKFDTTVDIIKSKNNLTSNTLSIGQKLLI